MKLSLIKQILSSYDTRKGIKTKIFGDPECIKELRSFCKSITEQKEDRELTRQESFNLFQLMLKVGYRYVKPLEDKIKYGSKVHRIFSDLQLEISHESLYLWLALEAMYQTEPCLLTFENYSNLLEKSVNSNYSWINLLFEKKLLNEKNFTDFISIPYVGVTALWNLNSNGILNQNNLEAFKKIGEKYRIYDLLYTLDTIKCLNQDTFNIVIQNLNYAAKVCHASYFRREGCALEATTGLLPLPKVEKLYSLSLSTNAAYFREKDQLFYVNKEDKICCEIKLNSEQFAQFDDKLKPNPLRLSPLLLSEDQLKEITSITGHAHNERGFTRKIFEAIFIKIPEAVTNEIENYLVTVLKESLKKAEDLIQEIKKQGVSPIWKDISKSVKERLSDELTLIENERHRCGFGYSSGLESLLDFYASVVDTSQLSVERISEKAKQERKTEPSILGAAFSWLKNKNSIAARTTEEKMGYRL